MKNSEYLDDKVEHKVIHNSFNRQRYLLLKERREEFDADRFLYKFLFFNLKIKTNKQKKLQVFVYLF